MSQIVDPYHEGELTVQTRMGEESRAVANAAIIRSTADHGTARNFAQADIAAFTTRLEGNLRIDLCSGPTGFADHVGPSTVQFECDHTLPRTLIEGVKQTGLVGGVSVGFAARQRARVNGTGFIVDDSTLQIEAGEVFFNCTKFISTRTIIEHDTTDDLSVDAVALVERADMFFIGSHHPERGLDATHRGGNAGFLRHDGATLSWTEYPGNGMYQTMGNLVHHPEIAVIVPDLVTGTLAHFHGVARIEFGEMMTVTVDVDDVDLGELGFSRRWKPDKASPHNP